MVELSYSKESKIVCPKIIKMPAIHETRLGIRPEDSHLEDKLLHSPESQTRDILIDKVLLGIPVEVTHVEDLARSIREEGRQLIPILVRQRFDSEKGEVFDIIDGFHRVEALRLLGRETVSAVVLDESKYDDEKLYDLRILAAATHRGVRFARVVEWINRAFAATPWTEKISAPQAFMLTRNDSTGTKLGLTPEETEELKKWVRKKASAWHTSVGNISQDLLATVGVDPELLREVRSKRKAGVLTPSQLTPLRKYLPFRYELQWKIARVIKKDNLSVHVVERLVWQAAKAESDEESEEILNQDWREITRSMRPFHKRKERRFGAHGQPRTQEPTRDELVSENRRLSAIIARQEIEIEQLKAKVVRLSRYAPEIEEVSDKIIIARKKWGEIVFDTTSGEIGSSATGFQQLTPTEKDILLVLIDNMGQPLKARQIVNRAKGQIFLPSDNDTIRVQIQTLRQKLDAVAPGLSERLETLYRYGYRWRQDEEEFFG